MFLQATLAFLPLTFPLPENPEYEIQVTVPQGWEKDSKDGTFAFLSFLGADIHGIALNDAHGLHKSFILFYPTQYALPMSVALMQKTLFPGSITDQQTVDTVRKISWGTFHLAADYDHEPTLSGGIGTFSSHNYQFWIATWGIEEGNDIVVNTVHSLTQSIQIVSKSKPEPIKAPPTPKPQEMKPAVTEAKAEPVVVEEMMHTASEPAAVIEAKTELLVVEEMMQTASEPVKAQEAQPSELIAAEVPPSQEAEETSTK